MGLRSTNSLTEMTTRELPEDKALPVRKVNDHTAIPDSNVLQAFECPRPGILIAYNTRFIVHKIHCPHNMMNRRLGDTVHRILLEKKKKNSMVFSPHSNYTERAAAANWRNLMSNFAGKGVSSGRRDGSPRPIISAF
jgi:hypothetical protein